MPSVRGMFSIETPDIQLFPSNGATIASPQTNMQYRQTTVLGKQRTVNITALPNLRIS
jgi:hypothetical protein